MRHVSPSIRLLILFCMLSLLAFGAASQDAPTGYPAHYLVIEADSQGALEVVHHNYVTMSRPMVSLPDAVFAARASSLTRQNDLVTVQMTDAAGNLLYQTVVDIPRWLRGEFHQDDPLKLNLGGIDGHQIELDTRSFVVRVPQISGASELRVQPTYTSVSAVPLDLQAIEFEFATRPDARQNIDAQAALLPGWDNGDSENRVDIVVVGDGYTAAQESKFESDSATMANNFMDIKPYAQYANYVNIHTLFVASNDSGADKPPYQPGCNWGTDWMNPTCCPEAYPDGSGVPAGGVSVDTAFNGTYCGAGINRLLVVNPSMVMTAADAIPEWDQLIAIVNDPIYGGSGGSVAVVSTNEFAIDVLIHEYGHSFTKLADEYEGTGGYAPCTDQVANPNCEANVTDISNRASLKWAYWVDESTPIPTFGPLPDNEAAGAWEGARYLSNGMYRQGYNCMMRSLGTPFCDVASEAYPLRMYAGGWDPTYSGPGITMIEPGTASPSNTEVSIAENGSETFSATILAPVLGPSATVNWLVDGTQVATEKVAAGDDASYTFTPINTVPTTYDLTMEVIDMSGIIHNTNRDQATFTRFWTVTAAGGDFTGDELLYNGSFETQGEFKREADGWKHKNLLKDKRKCTKTKPDGTIKEFGYTGDCAFMFKGFAGVKSKLIQTPDPVGAEGDTLYLSGYVRSKKPSSNFVLLLKVFYSDTEEKSKFRITAANETFAFKQMASAMTLIGTPEKIKVMAFIRSDGGKLFLDDMSLQHITAAAALDGGLLPLPESSNGFRN